MRLGPRKNSRSGTVRSPDAEAMTTCAPSETKGGEVSAAGDPLAELAIRLARWRMATYPTSPAASVSAGNHEATTGCAAISAIVAVGPNTTACSSTLIGS